MQVVLQRTRLVAGRLDNPFEHGTQLFLLTRSRHDQRDDCDFRHPSLLGLERDRAYANPAAAVSAPRHMIDAPKKLPALHRKRGQNRRPTRIGDGAIEIRARARIVIDCASAGCAGI
ncbi:hypothetical protein [Burkholderia ubonensis]|uniref:hypothetical protein n=1 Tax=Burkholderia ubonensis TaxID=101571 RepID=UPI002109A432|nr:hypothetical protein [Burkholderia ubonensis]